jgi:hypothetical protein
MPEPVDYIERVLTTLAHGQSPLAADVTAALDQRRRERMLIGEGIERLSRHADLLEYYQQMVERGAMSEHEVRDAFSADQEYDGLHR